MKSNKKGMSYQLGFIVGIALAIIATIIIIMVWNQSYLKSDEKKEEVLCKDSILLRASTTVRVGGTEARSVIPLCKTIDKKISGTKEEVTNQVAEKIARCWWMFGEGRYEKDIFEGITGLGGVQKRHHCFTCYTLMVQESNDFKEGESITPENFFDYLKDTKYAAYNRSYLEYIQSYGGQGLFLGILTNQGITPRHAYAIAYMTKRSDCTLCRYIAGAGGAMIVAGTVASGTVVGAIVGAPVALAGAVLTGYGVGNIAGDALFDPGLDTVYLVDMDNNALNRMYTNYCEEVKDVAGN